MNEARELVTQIFSINKIIIPGNRKDLFDRFIEDRENKKLIGEIIEISNNLMAKWSIEDKIAEIIQQPVRILNATVGKPYETKFDFEKMNLKNITSFEFKGLEEAGLAYDKKTKQITGVPTKSGDVKAVLRFKVEGQPMEADYNEKPITVIINPDPRSLWKNLESDKNDPYWKEDIVTVFESLGDRHLLASSIRGRSHANVGSFREDDFAFNDLENGWSIIVVADGAGSAKLSRKGSQIACNSVIEFFMEPTSIESMEEFDELIQHHKSNTGEDTQKKMNRFVYNNLGKAAFQVHKKLETFAKQENIVLKDLSTTLIFTLFKKYDIGYAFLSFGVGDCPIAVLNKTITEITLMNWIDVGEFGGGTRFITMPEIFQSEKFATRFGFRLIDDFSYLIMMSDGIYDPKFVVEANLPNIKKWEEFLSDLDGKNEEGLKVELNASNPNIIKQFTEWMNFWSKGNHDDRTLAIVF